MSFKQLNNFSQQYRTDSQWLNLNSSISISQMNALKLQTNNQSYYFNYRTRNKGKNWLGYITSTSANDFAGWKGFPVSGLEIQVYNNDKTRIFDKYIVMFRSKVAGEWLSWISNGSLDLMSKIQSEHNLGGTLDEKSTFSGWESKGNIQAIDIRMYEDLGAPDDENVPLPTTSDFSLQYHTDGSWKKIKPSTVTNTDGIILQTPVTNMDGIILQTPNKPYYFKYRARNRGKGWLSYVLSNNNSDYAGLIGNPMTGLEIQVYSNNGTRLFDEHVVMFRSKVAGEWLSWISNAKPEIMEKLKEKHKLDGTLDTNSTFSGWESRGNVQAIDIRVYENVEATTGETVPPSVQDTKGLSAQYRINNTWMTLNANINVSGMNAIKVQTNDTPYYLNYRVRGKGKGWLDFVKSTDSNQFAECKGAPVSGLEIHVYSNDGKRLFDEHAVMYRSKVAGEWLSWISNTDGRTMERLQQENGLKGTLDTDSTFSGWESRGDIQAIDIRVYPNVGKSTTEGTTQPSGDLVIPTNPKNPSGKIIYIDAGHGGSDPGACSGNYAEKNYTLQLSLLQKKYFEQAGYRVMLSRVTDCTLENNFKVNQANGIGANLYIANHINAFSSSNANGVEAYYQVNTKYSKDSKAVADKAVANLSKMFYSRGIKTKMQDDGRDWFCVLRETKMSAVLIEHGFISNSGDLAKLNNDANIDEMARAVVKAVCDAIPTEIQDPDPKKNYDVLKLAMGKRILEKMNIFTKQSLVLDQTAQVSCPPNLTIDYMIKSTSTIGSGDINHIYDIKNGNFSVDVSNEIKTYCDKIENDGNLYFSNPLIPKLPNFPLNNTSIGSNFSYSFTNNLGSVAWVLGNGSYSYSVDLGQLMFGNLIITTAFNGQVKDMTNIFNGKETDNPYDFNSYFSVEIKYTFTDFKNPIPPHMKAVPAEVISALAIVGVAVAGSILVVAALPQVTMAEIGAAIALFLKFIYQFFQGLIPVFE